MEDISQLVAKCEAEIRAGKPENVNVWLRALDLNRLPREHALVISKICRQAGLYQLGESLLKRLRNLNAWELAELSRIETARSGKVQVQQWQRTA